MLSIRRRWFAVVLLLLSGCASVEPQRDRPADPAHAQAPIEAWSGLADLPKHDRLVPLSLGSHALQWRLRALRAATDSIDLQTFIWKDDSVGLALVREIVAAGERGVRVRVLLDDSFLAHADPELQALSDHPNISYRIYNPLAQRSGNMFVRELENLNDLSRINHRMHNKLLVVDGRIAIMGGRNLADEYFGYESSHNFRDFELLVNGPFLEQLETVFDLYWNDPWSLAIEDLAPAEKDPGFTSIQAWLLEEANDHQDLAVSTPGDWSALLANAFTADLQLLVDAPADASPALDAPVQLAEALMARIDEVEHDLLLVSAYFIPTPALTSAIERAVGRGVRVRIFTNSLGSNNHVSAHAAYVRHRPSLLQAGAELYELRPDAHSRELYMDPDVADALLGLHEKSALFDNCCLFVGSANMDPRSLRLNTEVGLLIDSPALNAKLRQLLAVDLQRKNSWRVALDTNGDIEWIGEQGAQSHAPPASFYLRTESWFFGLLPIGGQM
ncbi:MAG: phospholipase D family protein [Gammaproteobacteria bacterium]|nr:MAG: phospholipase D family protein [Gammaproteobacteria bacterium]